MRTMNLSNGGAHIETRAVLFVSGPLAPVSSQFPDRFSERLVSNDLNTEARKPFVLMC